MGVGSFHVRSGQREDPAFGASLLQSDANGEDCCEIIRGTPYAIPAEPARESLLGGMGFRAEREIRPAVIARKNSFHNTSDRGAQTQALLMSIYHTLKRRGCDPLKTIEQALRASIETGHLPPLPQGPSP